MTAGKGTIADFALFGGPALFDRPRSIGNLVTPDFERFMSYSRMFLEARQYTNNGPANRLLENRLAEFHQTQRCVTFSTAFWGLSLAMRCLALPGRREIVMPSLTYRRMGEIAASAGLVPRYCEVDRTTRAQTAETVAACINDDTALLLGAHPTVNCCDAAGLEKLSAEAGVPLLFDSVESVYETCGGRKVGSFGRAEGFSIHASKLVNGFEGGYVTTDDHQLADRLVYMRGFGFAEMDTVVEFGFNAKLNEVHAAMALTGLDDLEEQVIRNRVRYEQYRREIEEVPGISIVEFDESEKCSYKNVLAEIGPGWPLSRDDTLTLLTAEGALARAYYSPALHTHQPGFEIRHGELPVSEELATRFLLLPCGDQMASEDITAVVGLLTVIAARGGELRDRLEGVSLSTGTCGEAAS